jgi:uncharacterized protein YjbJ (UPF0337 family)
MRPAASIYRLIREKCYPARTFSVRHENSASAPTTGAASIWLRIMHPTLPIPIVHHSRPQSREVRLRGLHGNRARRVQASRCGTSRGLYKPNAMFVPARPKCLHGILFANPQTCGKHTSLYSQEVLMADDVTGKATHLGGKLKEGLGDLLGDNKLKAEGRLDQVEGAAEQDAARAEEALQEANARRLAAEQAKLNNRL